MAASPQKYPFFSQNNDANEITQANQSGRPRTRTLFASLPRSYMPKIKEKETICIDNQQFVYL